MGKQEDLKKIERRARAMLMSKDIPAHKQEVVRALINNVQLNPQEKWRAVIELIQNCADKKVILYEDRVPPPVKKKPSGSKGASRPAPEAFAPTETSYYVDSIYSKYRRLKLFRIRYLVHRDNRLGIGMRRRLIPSKKFSKLIEHVSQVQNFILSRIDAITMEILNDPAAEDPTLFNYLRLIRNWMTIAPLLGEPYNSIKWMERLQFDRAFRGFAINFYSFSKLGKEAREGILLEAEKRLRSLEDLKKETADPDLPVYLGKEIEKRNLEKESRIYEYMSTLRSLFPIDARQENLLIRQLRKNFSINDFSELVLMIEEALVFQRPVKAEEIISYYKIEAPSVSSRVWDCSEELLKKAGKDAETLKRKRRESLQHQLEPYETLAMLLKHEIAGQNLLLKAYADQLRYIDRKQFDPKIMYNERYLNFLNGLIQYFKNMYLPLLDGSTLLFRDMGREEHSGSIFSLAYFADYLNNFKTIAYEMHFFRNANPGIEVSREDVKKFLKGEIDVPYKADRIIRLIGECFYKIGRELQFWYDSHRRWSTFHARHADPDLLRVSIKERDLNANDEQDRPIPYSDCVIKEVENGTVLVNELAGKRVLEDTLRDGVFVNMNAFAYQVAYDCLNDDILHDLEEMKSLLKRIEQEQ